MRTCIEIDDDLMVKVQLLSNKSKKAIVEEALQLYVAVENQKGLKNLWGKVKMDDEAFN